MWETESSMAATAGGRGGSGLKAWMCCRTCKMMVLTWRGKYAAPFKRAEFTRGLARSNDNIQIRQGASIILTLFSGFNCLRLKVLSLCTSAHGEVAVGLIWTIYGLLWPLRRRTQHHCNCLNIAWLDCVDRPTTTQQLPIELSQSQVMQLPHGWKNELPKERGNDKLQPCSSETFRSQLHFISPNRRMFRHHEWQLLRLLQTLQEARKFFSQGGRTLLKLKQTEHFFSSGFWELLCDCSKIGCRLYLCIDWRARANFLGTAGHGGKIVQKYMWNI